jgi:predicted ChrR family anti-sigma factor
MTETLTREDLNLLSAVVAESIEPVDPPQALRDRILAAAMAVPQNTRTVRADEGRWHRIIPGVTVKTLSVDLERDTATILMTLEPGSTVPSHGHSGPEDSFVVSGSCRIGVTHLRKGDFHHADGGTHHEDVVSDEGCVLLLVIDRADYLAAA